MKSTSNVPTYDAPRRSRWEAVLSSGFVETVPAGSRWQNVLASGFVEPLPAELEDVRAIR